MKIANKGLGFYFAIVSAVLALVGLIIFFVYTGQGGTRNALVIVATILAIACCVSLMLGEKVWTDFTGILAAALLAWALVLTLQGGIGNIADAVNGIVMFGDASLSGMNIYMAVVYALSIVAAICSCFMKKSK